MIPYSCFGVVINNISNGDIAYRIVYALALEKKSSQSLEKEGKWVYCKHLYSVLRFLCKVDYDNDKFIHAPRFAYNEVMQLLELAGVVECE